MKVKLLFKILLLFSLNASSNNILIVGGSHARGIECFSKKNYAGVGQEKFPDNGMFSYFDSKLLFPYKITCFAPDNMMDFFSYILSKVYLYDQLSKAFKKARETEKTSILLLPPCVMFWLVFGGKGNVFKTPEDFDDFRLSYSQLTENPFYSFYYRNYRYSYDEEGKISYDEKGEIIVSRPVIIKAVHKLLMFMHNQPNYKQSNDEENDKETVIGKIKAFIKEVSLMQKDSQASGHPVIVVLSKIPTFLRVFSEEKDKINVLSSATDMLSELDYCMPFDRTFIHEVNDTIREAVESEKNPSLCLFSFAKKIEGDNDNIMLYTSVGRYSLPYDRLLSEREEKLNTFGYTFLADSMMCTAMQSEAWPEDQCDFSLNYKRELIQLLHVNNARNAPSPVKTPATLPLPKKDRKTPKKRLSAILGLP
ncbi:hypothetical protein [Candidatus Sororendozoicomonas aggregata]|uniref:hypothetical protein n=1 Tax=Candidatus Sororendozoicomonas aggregata TaxID=3073239 RepID=UPI002ED1A6AA